MNLYGKLRQRRKTPIQIIAEKVGVTEDYVRCVLRGSRNGTKHKDGKGFQIMELAKQFINEQDT